MELAFDRHAWQRARESRDPRFDGRFFIGVLTTGQVKGLFMGNDGGISAMAGPLHWSSGHEFLKDGKIDFNNDDEFTDADKVTATISGQQKRVAVSGVQSTQGILPSPTILSSGTTEMKYNSGSAGGIFVTTEDPGASAQGRQAWRQFQ